MNIKIPNTPFRPEKPRTTGVVMVMDKGLSVREAEDLVDSAGHLIDFLKLGFGTSTITNRVIEKVKVYRDANINVYVGGTLFEAFYIRGLVDDYLKLVDNFGLNAIEISDGSAKIEHDIKCELIRKWSKDFVVLSEVGYKDAAAHLVDDLWIEEMQKEIQAGSFKVIAEARESGTVGIFDEKGKANLELITKIHDRVEADKILWEAPLKSQQAWFIKHYGANVNLGNIAPNEIIALETLRLGLRGDTFFEFLPNEYQKFKI
ncbi:MAG: phosphosulfolactate synthase [Saprospiraceae bacterium]|nr:phosphosulfolactate synthase [Saprospiraceae bacterium]